MWSVETNHSYWPNHLGLMYMSMVGAVPMRLTGVKLLTEFCTALIAAIVSVIVLDMVQNHHGEQGTENRSLCFWCKGYHWLPDLDSWQKVTHLSHRELGHTVWVCPYPLLAYWLYWTFDPLSGLLVVSQWCWYLFSFGVTGLVQPTDSSHTIVVLKTNLGHIFAFLVWQWYTFYCKSHLPMG